MSTPVIAGGRAKRAAQDPRPARPPARRPHPHRTLAPAILLAPFFVLLTATMLVPMAYAIYLSLFTEQRSGLGFEAAQTVFSGLSNYAAAFGSSSYRAGFIVLGLYCLLYIPIMGALALTLAMLLDSALAKAKIFMVTLFLPHAVPSIVAAIIWAYLYTPGISPVLRILADSGLELNMLGQPLILPGIVNIAIWEWTGYNVIIFYTALRAIDRSIIEAARIDGTSGIQMAWQIKFPLIRPAVGVVLLFTIIGSLQLFAEPVILSQATPAVNSTYTPNMFAYDAAFRANNYGLAAAASVLLALFAGVLSWCVTSLNKRSGDKPSGKERGA